MLQVKPKLPTMVDKGADAMAASPGTKRPDCGRGMLLFRLACLLVFGPALIGISLELILVLEARICASRADRFRQENQHLFSTKEVTECFAETLWAVPWQSYRPGASLEREVGGKALSIHINSRGFRTHEFTVPPQAGTLRIICIGGSTTLQGETNGDTYPALLELLLAHRFPDARIEVLNLGISGTPSYAWLLRHEELFGYQPDILIQYNGINDICWMHLVAHGQAHPVRRWLNRSLLWQQLSPMNPIALDPRFDVTFQIFSHMGNEAKARGVDYVAATFPCPDPSLVTEPFRSYLADDMKAWGQGMNLRRYETYARILDRYNQRLVEHAARHGLLLAPVHEKLRAPEEFIDLCHNTAAGRQHLAQIMADAVSPMVARRLARRP